MSEQERIGVMSWLSAEAERLSDCEGCVKQLEVRQDLASAVRSLELSMDRKRCMNIQIESPNSTVPEREAWTCDYYSIVGTATYSLQNGVTADVTINVQFSVSNCDAVIA